MSAWRLAIQRIRVPAIVAFACSIAACSGDGGTGPTKVGPPAQLTVTGNAQSGTVGTALPVPITVLVSDAGGRPVPSADVTFAAASGSVTPAQARTNASGSASAQWTLGTAVGQHSLTVTVAGVTPTTITAQAAAAPAARVILDQDSLRFTALQESGTLAARVEDAFGNPAAGAVTWVSSAPAIVVVSGSGVLNATAAGAAYVRAVVSGAAADSALVRVQQVATSLLVLPDSQRVNALGRTLSFAPEAKDRNGFTILQPNLTWSSLDPQIATVENPGLVRAVTAGRARIRAAVDGLADTVLFQVVQVPATISITPAAFTLAAGATRAVQQALVDSGGSAIAGAAAGSVRFSSSNAAVLSVDAVSGTVQGGAPGVATLRARDTASSALQDSALVAVTGPGSVVASALPAVTAPLTQGATFALPIVLDVSRPSAGGDVGAAQLAVRFNTTLLQLDSAQVRAGALGNTTAAGEYTVAYAGINPAGSGEVLLATLFFKVAASAPAGARTGFELALPFAPLSTAFTPFSAPLVLTGRAQVR